MSKNYFDDYYVQIPRRTSKEEPSKHNNENHTNYGQKLENAKNNSVKPRNNNIEKINVKEKKHKISAAKLGVAVVTTFLATALACTVSLELYKDHKHNELINNALGDASQILSSSVYVNENGYELLNERLAAIKALGEEDLDLAIYAMYRSTASNGKKEERIETMNNIMREMKSVIGNNPQYYSGMPTYDSFEDYLNKHGFVDKEGKLELKKYEKEVCQYALGEATSNDTVFGQKNENNVGKSK